MLAPRMPFTGQTSALRLDDPIQLQQTVKKCELHSFPLVVRRLFSLKKLAASLKTKAEDRVQANSRLTYPRALKLEQEVVAKAVVGEKTYAQLSLDDQKSRVQEVNHNMKRGKRMRRVSKHFGGDGIFFCFAAV